MDILQSEGKKETLNFGEKYGSNNNILLEFSMYTALPSRQQRCKNFFVLIREHEATHAYIMLYCSCC